MAKFLKHECFTILTFTALPDCFKVVTQVSPHLIVYALRKKGSDLKTLQNIKRRHKTIDFILYLSKDVSDVDLVQLQGEGFSSVYKAATQDKIKEITYELIPPAGLPRRPETPHPVPLTIDISLPSS
ncbi:MAG: hypothetical protein VYC17_02715, partial [Nitrospinota bacterium]|nr:hypothetical protein [Nitrospinota bacterium]